MNKSSDKVKRWRLRKKIQLLEYKSNKCEKCGYDKIQYLSAFDFHHIDPSTKEFGIGEKGRCISIEKLKKEVDKCLLLCNRCHQEIHDEQHWEERKRLLSVSRKKVTKEINCSFCEKRFKQKRKEQKYCSKECGREGIKKIPELDIEVLKKDFKELGYKIVMKKYNLKKSSLYKIVK
jgi:hypothetical protein